MSNKKFTKGKANQETLADRMKKYEAVTTSTSLIEQLPIYARIDMRAGHTFCRGLAKPFDYDYADTMKAATAYVVEKTNALVGYCQSDEASFVWLDSSKIPFETRLFKLQSVLASMFTAAFIQNSRGIVVDKVSKLFPTFDCRVCNMPSLDEAANMILWRERDSIKNSITLLALEHFSDKEIERKKSNDKIKMLQDLKGIDYFKAIPEDLRNGAYFRRETYFKALTEEELKCIPEKNWPSLSQNGERCVIRSHVVQFYIGTTLNNVENKVGVLFHKENPVVKENKETKND